MRGFTQSLQLQYLRESQSREDFGISRERDTERERERATSRLAEREIKYPSNSNSK